MNDAVAASPLDPGLYVLIGTIVTGLLGFLTIYLGKRPSRVELAHQEEVDFQSVMKEMKEVLAEKKADIMARDVIIAQRDARIAALATQLDTCRAALSKAHDTLTIWALETGREPPTLPDEDGAAR